MAEGSINDRNSCLFIRILISNLLCNKCPSGLVGESVVLVVMIHYVSLVFLAVHYTSGDGDIHISDLKPSRQFPSQSRADAINFPLSKLHSIRETGQLKKLVQSQIK